jgi:hypothetical protein
VIEPIFEREFVPGSYGFRPGLGCKDALREVDRLLKAGYTHVVDADLVMVDQWQAISTCTGPMPRPYEHPPMTRGSGGVLALSR